jgi:hypothetical protein
VEVCESKSTPNESDMGVFDADTISIMCGTHGDSSITLEGSEHIGVRNAKVRFPQRIRNRSIMATLLI